MCPLPAGSRPADYVQLAMQCVTEVRHSNVHVYKFDAYTKQNQGRLVEAKVVASSTNFVTCQPRLKKSGECQRDINLRKHDFDLSVLSRALRTYEGARDRKDE